MFRKRNKRLQVLASAAAGATVSTERWERARPRAWEVAQERADAAVRSRQLDDGIDQTLDSIEALSLEVRFEREKVELLEQLLDERMQMLGELHRLAVREREATVAVARAERALAAQRTKPAPRPDDGSRKRSGRLVRVMADEGAWRVLRVDAERRRQSLGVRLARLVAAEVDGDTEGRTAPDDRRRRSPGEARPVRTVHALRLFVTEDTWARFRVAAAELGLGLGAYVGQLAESEAHRLGWRAGSPTQAPGGS